MTPEQLATNFSELIPPLTDEQAVIEASRCLFCFDAPCTRACPAQIDVPKFIRQILHHDPLGAARTILDANIFGGSCARACPTEVLCEGACVDNVLSKAPVQIGRLQRYACDHAWVREARFHDPGPETGKRVAVIGAGPAGLTCAHELRKRGHAAVVFEARELPGGLNTYGIAAYKYDTAFALSEVKCIEQLGVEIRCNSPIDADGVRKLMAEYDAVFLGIGLGATAPLGIPGEDLPGVWEALDFIFQTHTLPYDQCQVGRRMVVLGAGNTAIDVATAARRLGAERVTVAYRRTAEQMPAFAYEYELAKADGVRFEWLAQPTRIVAKGGRAIGVELIRTRVDPGASRRGAVEPIPGTEFILHADMIVKALGQGPMLDLLGVIPQLKIERGRVVVEPKTGATSVRGLFSGGDCVNTDAEVVNAVQEGKIAAAGIDAFLQKE